MSSRLRSKMRICGKCCHATNFKDRTDWFSKWKANVSIDLLSKTFEILRVWSISKMKPKTWTKSKIAKDFFRIFEKLKFIWKSAHWCICLQGFKQISWKMAKFWYLGGRKWTLFMLLPGISVFSRFSKLVRPGPPKKCSRVIFSSFAKITRQEHVSHHPNPKFLFWPCYDLVTLDDYFTYVCLPNG